MFCTNCGAEIQEGMKFCTQCGSPVAGNRAKVNFAPGNLAGKIPAAGEVGGKIREGFGTPGGRKLSLIGGIAVLFVVILALVLLSGRMKGGLSSPEKAFEAYMDGFSHGDIDRMLEAYPDFVIEYNGGRSEIKEKIQRNYDNQFGGNAVNGYEFSYEATGHTMLDEDEVERIEQDINNTFGSDVKPSDAATVDYQIVMTYEGEETVNPDMTGGYAVKFKGKWYYFNVY